MSETEKLLKEISAKMDKVLRLLALNIVRDVKSEQAKIELLDSLGFRPVEIATLLNKSPDNVSVQLNILHKKKKPKAESTVAIKKKNVKSIEGNTKDLEVKPDA